jgi:cell division protein FtsB
MQQYFWLLLTIISLGWYLIIMGYIAFRGAGDIKKMLAQIKKQRDEGDELSIK